MARTLSCASLPGGGLPDDTSSALCPWSERAESDAELLAVFRKHLESSHRMALAIGRSFESLVEEAAAVIRDE
ncbi:MAG: hypothetical protein AMXMBFR23_28080 [Chloroflexota bacterium]